MSGCVVTVLADVRSRNQATAEESSVPASGAEVIRVDFPRSAVSERALSSLVRAVAAEHSNAVAVASATRVLTFGEIAGAMSSLAEVLGAFEVDEDSALTMALMTEIPDLCAAGAEGLEAVLAEIRDNVKLAS